MTGAAPAHRGRRDNGLDSERFSPVADIDPRLSDHLLDVLGLRDVPAYVEPAPASQPASLDRLFVAAEQTGDARAVIQSLASELGIEIAHDGHRVPERSGADLLAGIDTDAEFNAIVAGLSELDRPLYEVTITPAMAPAARPTASDDSDEVDHYVPPPAPPLPRLAAATALALLITLLGVAIIAFGGALGLPGDFPLPAGVVLILFGTVLLILRLRPEPRDSSDGDGAVV